MAYKRVNWKNLPSTNTPVNADNLNKMGEGIKDLETELSKKANSSDVYTKAELNSSLLPITIVKNGDKKVYVGDANTVTLQVEPQIPYIFINSHFYLREIVLITPYDGKINIDRILASNPKYTTSFTLKDDKLTIVGAPNCRGYLYKLNYQITV